MRHISASTQGGTRDRSRMDDAFLNEGCFTVESDRRPLKWHKADEGSTIRSYRLTEEEAVRLCRP